MSSLPSRAQLLEAYRSWYSDWKEAGVNCEEIAKLANHKGWESIKNFLSLRLEHLRDGYDTVAVEDLLVLQAKVTAIDDLLQFVDKCTIEIKTLEESKNEH